MSPSTERWLVAWLITLVGGPFAFTLLVGIGSAAFRAVLQPGAGPAAAFAELLSSLVNTSFFNLVYGAGIISAPPTLLIGVPASIVLERRHMMSLSTFALVGTVGGAIGGAALGAALSDFAVWPDVMFALFGAAYGCFAAITFRYFRGPVPPP